MSTVTAVRITDIFPCHTVTKKAIPPKLEGRGNAFTAEYVPNRYMLVIIAYMMECYL